MAHKRNYIIGNGVCQLLDKSKYPSTTTINGVTWTNNDDGTITANGAATANSTFNLIYRANLFTIIGHKYLLIGCPEGGNASSTYFLRYDSDGGTAGYDIGNGVIFTKTNEKIAYVNTRVYAGYTANNLLFKPQLFDLTEMFGAGNEPTTVAEFKTRYPDDLYSYNRLVSTCCKKMIKVANVCQLLDKSKYPATGTYEGVVYTNNGDGTITLNGTATDYTNYSLQSYIRVIAGHKYFAGFSGVGRDPYLLLYTVDTGVFDNNYPSVAGTIVTCLKNNDALYYQIKVRSGETVNNVTVKPQFFDLTEMYGAGNELTTVAEFKAKFPDDLYPYQPYCFAPIMSTNYICKTKNLFDNIVPANNCRVLFSASRAIATQITADTGTSRVFKIVSYNGSSYEVLSFIADAFTLGRVTYTFTTPEITGYKTIIFGLNGAKIDTTCQCEINLKPSTTYTFSCNFTNITQGSISWTDMQLEEGSTATPYVPYEYV